MQLSKKLHRFSQILLHFLNLHETLIIFKKKDPHSSYIPEAIHFKRRA